MSAADLLSERLFLSTAEAAEVLGCDGRTVRHAIEAKQIPAVRVGQQWRIATAWLRERAGLGGAAAEPVPCPCECNRGGFCGGCGHAGCGRR